MRFDRAGSVERDGAFQGGGSEHDAAVPGSVGYLDPLIQSLHKRKSRPEHLT